MNCVKTQRTKHTLCDPGCFKFDPSKCPSGQPTHVLCNIKDHGLRICTCNTQTPYSCRPVCKHETSNKFKEQILDPTVFDDCSTLESSFSPDLLVFGDLDIFISSFCNDSGGILRDYIDNNGTFNIPSIVHLVGPDPSTEQTPVLEILSINPIICNNLNATIQSGEYTIGNCNEIDKITIFG